MEWDPPALPAKKPAVFHHPHGVDLWDGPSMDLHAMRYAEACVAAERERCVNEALAEIGDGFENLAYRVAKAIRGA